jgi:hypothetical protein
LGVLLFMLSAVLLPALGPPPHAAGKVGSSRQTHTWHNEKESLNAWGRA